MMSGEQVTGLILAGGKSRRFGSPKAARELNGHPMIAHVAAALAPVCERLLVSIGSGRPDVLLPTLEIVRDRYADSGPLAGLHAGLSVARTPWVLVAACDMPLLTTESVRALLDARRPTSEAVVAIDGTGRMHPLCGCYRVSTCSFAASNLERGHLAMREFVAGIARVAFVRLPDAVLRNINTLEDLAAYGDLRDDT